MTDHPITPPPELVQQWVAEIYSDPTIHVHPIPIQPIIRLVELASQWGADQELEACCEYLVRCAQWEPEDVEDLRSARRTSPSLKEQALALIDECTDPEGDYLDDNALSIIRHALEALPNDRTNHTERGAQTC